jgi:RNA polymerase sigma factor (TIGR02999 family)
MASLPNERRAAGTGGEPAAARKGLDELLPELYNAIRALASRALQGERQPLSIRTSDLVHEAYLKLAQQDRVRWENRGKVLAAAVHVMRQILVDRARRRKALKHGAGKQVAAPLSSIVVGAQGASDVDLIALDEALHRLASLDERPAKVVEVRFFGGLTIEETAETLDVSVATWSRRTPAWAIGQRPKRPRTPGGSPRVMTQPSSIAWGPIWSSSAASCSTRFRQRPPTPTASPSVSKPTRPSVRP